MGVRALLQDMETQMVELERNMGTISAASEAVDSSLSARRGQLEKLNGAKKNLTKLQFLTELPARLHGRWERFSSSGTKAKKWPWPPSAQDPGAAAAAKLPYRRLACLHAPLGSKRGPSRTRGHSKSRSHSRAPA